MKTLFKLTIFGILLTMLSAIAFAQTGPQSIHIDCDNPSGSQGDLKRPRGDGNVWVFQIIPGADVHWVEGPNWSYPGKGGADPSWGQWNGGDGSLSLSWISPEHSGAFNIGVTGKITCGSGGGGGAPIDISAMWSGEVLVKEWDVGSSIGHQRQADETFIEDGRIIAPQDQRQDPPTPETVLAAPGSSVTLQIEAATDSDHWKQGDQEGYEEDNITYTWSTQQGIITPNPTDSKTATWIAPDDDGTYTITCTIDDQPKAIAEDEKGTRDDDSITRTVDVKVTPFEITWEGLARACTGGVAVDAVHDFAITGIAKKLDGTLVTNTPLELSFENNRGHDYSSDPPGIKPEGWTTADIRKAKFVTTGQPSLVEEMTVTTDENGEFQVHVLSSDIISSDIKIKVKWTDGNDKTLDVGEKACGFVASVSLRRFGLVHYPDEEDTGWIFNDSTLTEAPYSSEMIDQSGTTPAKVYLKFQIDPGIPRDTDYFNPDGTPRRPLDDDGNWGFVNGHRLIIRIDKIIPQDGLSFTGNISDYATLLDGNGQPTTEAHAVTSADGAAQVLVKAEALIRQAKVVVLSVEDLTEHDS